MANNNTSNEKSRLVVASINFSRLEALPRLLRCMTRTITAKEAIVPSTALIPSASAGDDGLAPRRMHLDQPLGDDRDVGRADLEQAIAAEGTAAPALQVLWLLLEDVAEERVGPLEDEFVRHRTS